MTKLIKLKASHGSGITQEGIQLLATLYELDATYNKNITNVNHMTKLEELSAIGSCGIDQQGIQQLTSLRSLCAQNNNKITSESR